jgi:polar amino acid transport system permease protein
MHDIWHYVTYPFLWQGLFVAVEITVLSLLIGWPLSVLMAMVRLSKRRLVRGIAAPYIWIMRGTPILLQLIFFYDVLPEIGIRVNATATAIIALSLNEVAFSGEIIKGGIQSVRPSQRRAAAALGMKNGLIMRRVVLPQALTSITPALSNEAIIMLKNTSLASVISVPELTLRSQEIVAVNFEYISVFVSAAVLYLIANTVLTVLQSRAEKMSNVEVRAERAMRREALQLQGVRGAARPVPASGVDSGPEVKVSEEKAAERAAAGRELVAHLAGRAQGSATDGGFVRIEEVHKSFHNNDVLKGVSLEVDQGEVVVILGPSGSGKSTLLYTINALESIDQGEIWVDGTRLGHAHAMAGGFLANGRLTKERAEARIGLVFQQFNLFDHMSVMQNIMEAPVKVYGMDSQVVRKNALALLAWAGLAGSENKFAHQLSGGQQQRVAIARALACQPRLMLFDEPTSALDPELVGEVLRLIRDLANAGMGMVVVTHEISFARQVANRVVFMCDGVVVEQGPPEEVLRHPRDPRTRQFLNLLEGEEEGSSPTTPVLD